MLTARQSAVRLLQLMMIASLVLPAVLFVFASWLNYRYTFEVADDRIERSLDILHEHALKVFQTVEIAMSEVDEVTRGMTDDEVRAAQPRLHQRLQQIVDALPQLQAILVIGRDGRPIASSTLAALPDDLNLSDRDYYKAHPDHDVGTLVGEIRTPRQIGAANYVFNLSRRRASPDGSFNGVIAVAVLPSYFKDFYARIGHAPGSYFSMIRTDGAVLARYPSNEATPLRLDLQSSGLGAAVAKNPETGLYTTVAQLDRIERRFGYRKLAGYPVYVMAGTETSSIRDEWLATMSQPSHLRLAGDLADVRLHPAGAPAHPPPARGGRAPRGGGGGAAAVAAARGDRQADRRRRARLQQSPDDRERQRAAPAARPHRCEADAPPRHDRRPRPSAARASRASFSPSRGGRCSRRR